MATMWTPDLRDFIQRHLDDDTAELLLAARKYPDIDVPFAVEQIEARKRLKTKLPTWYANPELIMGGRIPAEQCSSEVTARYKRSIVEGESLCDITGGMGVDFWYLSEGMKRAIYTERQERLCEVAEHNFEALSDGHHPVAEIRVGDGQKLPIPSVEVVYIDPARRASDGSRVYAMEDCEPNIIDWQDELLRHAQTVLVKLSPMVDITDALRKLRQVTDVYVVGVKNECKEVLVKQRSTSTLPVEEGRDHAGCVRVHCVDFLASSTTIQYTFTFPDEMAEIVSAEGVEAYLYEPDVTLMKARAWGSLCHRYGIAQLDHETRLMTSDRLIPDFPGRIFVVDEQIPFSSKNLKRLKRQIPQANIATRNFPLTADQLRNRTGIKDGGGVYLFGAKVRGVGDLLLRCHKTTTNF